MVIKLHFFQVPFLINLKWRIAYYNKLELYIKILNKKNLLIPPLKGSIKLTSYKTKTQKFLAKFQKNVTYSPIKYNLDINRGPSFNMDKELFDQE